MRLIQVSLMQLVILLSANSSSVDNQASGVNIPALIGVILFCIHLYLKMFKGIDLLAPFTRFLNNLEGKKTNDSVKENQEHDANETSHTFFCKFCGNEYSSIDSMTHSSCSKSPYDRHIAYEGEIGKPYICEYCGKEAVSLACLSETSCSKNDGRSHSVYEGKKKSSYTCKFCGRSSFSISSLVETSCDKSPDNKHLPLK